MNKVYYLGILAAASIFTSCKHEISDPKNFPTADSYSPGTAKTGDTVTVYGSYLKDSKIVIGDKEPILITNTDGSLSFVVTNAMTLNQTVFPLSIKFADGSSTQFSMPLILNHIIGGDDKDTWLSSRNEQNNDTLGKGPAQILITDFDGHGYRTANATDRFNQTQWSGLVKTGGSISITQNFLGVAASPARGNYLALQLNPEFIEKGSNGYLGEFISSTDLQNDRKSFWPKNFSELPNSPIKSPISRAEMGDLYLNFFLNKNGKEKGISDIYLTNDLLALKNQFKYRPEVSVGKDKWELVSIRLRDFKNNYGYGSGMTFTDYKDFNKIKFTFVHDDKKDEASTSPLVTATEEAQIYIDQVIITQGGPYLAYPK